MFLNYRYLSTCNVKMYFDIWLSIFQNFFVKYMSIFLFFSFFFFVFKVSLYSYYKNSSVFQDMPIKKTAKSVFFKSKGHSFNSPVLEFYAYWQNLIFCVLKNLIVLYYLQKYIGFLYLWYNVPTEYNIDILLTCIM